MQDTENHQAIQEKIVFEYLKNHVASATMVTYATGIPQKCITRYKRNYEKEGLLVQLKKDRCKLTRRYVWYLTTNKDLFPKTSPQLSLFL